VKGALTAAAAAEMIPDGASLMIGGFMAVGTPERLIDALVARGAPRTDRHRPQPRNPAKDDCR